MTINGCSLSKLRTKEVLRQPHQDGFLSIFCHSVSFDLLLCPPYTCVALVKWMPAWFPGAGFKHMAMEWRQLNREMYTKPYEVC
jgi:hypothetical protein